MTPNVSMACERDGMEVDEAGVGEYGGRVTSHASDNEAGRG